MCGCIRSNPDDRVRPARIARRLNRLRYQSVGRKSFQRYRKIGGPVVTHTNTEEMVRVAITSPLTMIASDAYWEDGIGHPRTTGTYSKVLGRYVRDAKALTLMDAIRKMTLMPARHLENRVPAMKTKGRIRVGADADIVVFDATTIIVPRAGPSCDRHSTCARPWRAGRCQRAHRRWRCAGPRRAGAGNV